MKTYNTLKEKSINFEKKWFGKTLATEVTPKGLAGLAGVGIIMGTGAGCITGKYKVDTLGNFNSPSITEKNAKYDIPEFALNGNVYQMKSNGCFIIGKNQYKDVPYVFKTKESREIINDETKSVSIQSENYYPIVPVNCKDEKFILTEQENKRREKIYFGTEISKKGRSTGKKGLEIFTRDSNDDKFDLPKININGKSHYIFADKHEVNLGDTELESLDAGFMREKGHLRILDRESGKLFLNGRFYKPVKGDLDTDRDGMPDIWEEKYGLNSRDANDANGDLDRDSFSNLVEFRLGTNPITFNEKKTDTKPVSTIIKIEDAGNTATSIIPQSAISTQNTTQHLFKVGDALPMLNEYINVKDGVKRKLCDINKDRQADRIVELGGFRDILIDTNDDGRIDIINKYDNSINISETLSDTNYDGIIDEIIKVGD